MFRRNHLISFKKVVFHKYVTFGTSAASLKKTLPTSILYPSHIQYLASLNASGEKRYRRLVGIICTIGPSSRDVETLVHMMESGMNIARLNLAHSTHDYHRETIHNIRKANYLFAERGERGGSLIGIGVDIQGAAIRTGKIRTSLGNEVELKVEKEVTLTTNEKYSKDVTDSIVYVNYNKMPKLVNAGTSIYLDEGSIELKVIKVDGENIRCRIKHGGKLGSSKGVNLPGIDIDLPTLSEKDKADIKFARENKVDMIFASFIRDKEGVEEIRNLIDEGDRAFEMAIVAKIENQQGLINVDDILAAADGLMVARGDLGIELPAERTFIAQKAMIAKCNLIGKPVICATQMLDSMLNKPRPTRAETSDIANAVLDGTDSVMLSAETAIGKYPVECVRVMASVCREAEAAVPYKQLFIDLSKMVHPPTSVALSTAFAAVAAAEKVRATAILTSTTTGTTAFLLAMFRPSCPIIAITPHGVVARKCHLWRAVTPILHAGKKLPDWDKDLEFKLKTGLMAGHQMGFVHEGDNVIILTGWKAGRGSTNTMKITQVTKEILQ